MSYFEAKKRYEYLYPQQNFTHTFSNIVKTPVTTNSNDNTKTISNNRKIYSDSMSEEDNTCSTQTNVHKIPQHQNTHTETPLNTIQPTIITHQNKKSTEKSTHTTPLCNTDYANVVMNNGEPPICSFKYQHSSEIDTNNPIPHCSKDLIPNKPK